MSTNVHRFEPYEVPRPTIATAFRAVDQLTGDIAAAPATQADDTIAALSTALAKVTTERDELKSDCNSFVDELRELAHKLDAVTAELDELKAERDKLLVSSYWQRATRE